MKIFVFISEQAHLPCVLIIYFALISGCVVPGVVGQLRPEAVASFHSENPHLDDPKYLHVGSDVKLRRNVSLRQMFQTAGGRSRCL